jgi:alkanesulfonate monooxygenase SsuD/methylene tetrahydromethanopterin reductase-like flavin-dependent oxidoreductase (luciferase family)
LAGPTLGKNPPSNELSFGLVTGQHWRSWEEIRDQWQWMEETGWDSAWTFDHFLSLYDGDGGPCFDGWTLLAGLAAVTSKVQIGVMVTSITHRNPALLAKEAVTVDVISGGRVILGVGAGWSVRDHEAYGFELPPPGERVDRFGESLEIYRLLETSERSSFKGQYYTLDDAPFEPKPVFGHIPILIGSRGRRMMRHVARYADQWDGGGSPEEYRATGARLDELCREIGRDPSEIRWVYTAGGDPLESVDTFQRHVRDYAEIGVRSFMFDFPRGKATPAMTEIAERVIPELRQEFTEARQVQPA